MKETKWAKVPDHSRYSVSEEGEIRNDETGKILKQMMRNGYLAIKFHGGTKT